jgi:hypothetical protein
LLFQGNIAVYCGNITKKYNILREQNGNNFHVGTVGIYSYHCMLNGREKSRDTVDVGGRPVLIA